jgi:pimeloyl-ACP methyl ester carboxylesterase
VDIGGYRLHLREMGSGAPTVVLEAGLAGFSLDWGLTQPRVAEFARVVAYDRAGYGWSDPGPAPRDAERIARELHELLRRADIPGPYVLVGHSFGGFTQRMFAHLYPDETVGMVLVDSIHEDMLERLDPQARPTFVWLARLVDYALRVLGVGGRLGTVRALGVLGGLPMLYPFTKLPKPERDMAFALRYPAVFFRTSQAEYAAFPRSIEQVRATGSLGDKPLVVITALGSDQNQRRPTTDLATGLDRRDGILGRMARYGVELQQDLANRLSTRGEHLVTRDSGHQIGLTQPDLVVEAIRSVIAASGARARIVPLISPQDQRALAEGGS